MVRQSQDLRVEIPLWQTAMSSASVDCDRLRHLFQAGSMQGLSAKVAKLEALKKLMEEAWQSLSQGDDAEELDEIKKQSDRETDSSVSFASLNLALKVVPILLSID